MPKQMSTEAGNSMQQHTQDLTSSPTSQPGLLAPDTTGMNFYRADPALTDLLKLHLPEALFRQYLQQLGPHSGGPHSFLHEAGHCARATATSVATSATRMTGTTSSRRPFFCGSPIP